MYSRVPDLGVQNLGVQNQHPDDKNNYKGMKRSLEGVEESPRNVVKGIAMFLQPGSDIGRIDSGYSGDSGYTTRGTGTDTDTDPDTDSNSFQESIDTDTDGVSDSEDDYSQPVNYPIDDYRAAVSELDTDDKLRTIEEIKSENYSFLHGLTSEMGAARMAFYLDIDILSVSSRDDFVNSDSNSLNQLGIFTVTRIIDSCSSLITAHGDNFYGFDFFFRTRDPIAIIDGLLRAIPTINRINDPTFKLSELQWEEQMYIYMTLHSFEPMQVIEDPTIDFHMVDLNRYLRLPRDFDTVDVIDGPRPPPQNPGGDGPVLAVGAFTPYNEIFHVSRCYDETELGYQDSRLYVSSLYKKINMNVIRPLSLIGGRTIHFRRDLIYSNAFQFNYDFTYLKQHFMKKIVYYTCAIVIGLTSRMQHVLDNLNLIIATIEMYNDLYFILRGLTETSGLLTYKLDYFTLKNMYSFFIFIDQTTIPDRPIGIISHHIIKTFFNLLFRDMRDQDINAPQDTNLCRYSIRCINFIQNSMELNGPPAIDIVNKDQIDCMSLVKYNLQAEINRPHHTINPKALDILKTPLYSSYFVTAKNIKNIEADDIINDSKEILCDCNSLLNFQCLLAFVHAYVNLVLTLQLNPPGTPIPLGPDVPHGPDDPLNFNSNLLNNEDFMSYLDRLNGNGMLIIEDNIWPGIQQIVDSYVVVDIYEQDAGEVVGDGVMGGRGKSRRRIKMSKRNKPIKIYTKNKNNKKTKTRKLKGKKRTRKLKGKKRTLKKRRNKTNKRHK